jgi:hypothetical protein
VQPSILAYLVLAGFLPVAIYLFGRFPRSTAAAIVVLAGSVLLPEWLAFDLPVIPPLDKERITYASALIAAMIHRSRDISVARPGTGPESIVILIILANAGTVLMNPSAMWDEGRLEPGLGFYDVIVGGLDEILTLGIPFFLGRALFTRRDDLRVLLACLAVAGLGYSMLILVEVLFAVPFHVFQLSMLFYSMAQQASFRWGVVQPTVFMDHGLSLATFMASCVLAAAGLAKAKMKAFRFKSRFAWIMSLVGLVLSRNVAGVLYGALFSLAILTLRARTVARISLVVAVIVCLYPAMRSADIFPDDKLVELAAGLGEERQRSFRGRFDDENFVLDLMQDRIWFGWGNISRVPGAEGLGGWQSGGYEGGIDGYWAIRLGISGAVGMLLRLGMLVLPVYFAWRAMSRIRTEREKVLLAALMAIVAMRSVDLLANGWWNNLPVFLSGALYGVSRSFETVRVPPPRSVGRVSEPVRAPVISADFSPSPRPR